MALTSERPLTCTGVSLKTLVAPSPQLVIVVGPPSPDGAVVLHRQAVIMPRSDSLHARKATYLYGGVELAVSGSFPSWPKRPHPNPRRCRRSSVPGCDQYAQRWP